MTIKLDNLEAAIDEAIDALRNMAVRCGSCGRYDCRDPEDASELAVLRNASAAIFGRGHSFDRRSLRLDPETMSAVMHPRFPRFGIVPNENDADVIPPR